MPISSLSGACAEVKGARRTSCALKPRTSTPVHALSDVCVAMAAGGKAPALRSHLRRGTDLSAQLAGSAMGSSSSPIGANMCIVGRVVACSTRKHAQLVPATQYDRSDGPTERMGYLLRQSEVMVMVAEYPSRSKKACFQGQRSAHAVQCGADWCSGAVSGQALSPGSLGSAQAFQNPAGVLWCSAVTVTRGQSLLKKRDKTPRSQPWVGSKKCTRVEFKVTVCCLMTPIRMLVYCASKPNLSKKCQNQPCPP